MNSPERKMLNVPNTEAMYETPIPSAYMKSILSEPVLKPANADLKIGYPRYKTVGVAMTNITYRDSSAGTMPANIITMRTADTKNPIMILLMLSALSF